jgi:teichuronic acid biosynthesis glycosyltransferase TuaC
MTVVHVCDQRQPRVPQRNRWARGVFRWPWWGRRTRGTAEPVGEEEGGGLRVLAVTNIWPVGDSHRGVFVQEQVEALERLGVRVDIEVVAQSRGVKDYLLAAARIRRRARAGHYDLVHVHYGLTALATRFVGRMPRVLSLYGSDINARWQQALTRLGWGGTAARIYVCQALAETAGDPDGMVVANGVDFDLFTPVDRHEARASLGIADDERVVMFGGDPDRHVKGYDVFDDVLATLRQRGQPVRELILAEPDQQRADVPTKFAAADVLLFTSRKGSEGSPTVVKEANVMGLPVVSVAVGDVAQVLTGVSPSAVVDFPEPWGEPATRRQLVQTLADRTAEVLDTRSRSNGREANDWLEAGAVANRIVGIYRTVLSRQSRRH